MDQIEQEGFNLNISRYVSLSKDEEEIDLEAVHRDLVDIENEIQTATSQHNVFLKELGLLLLPGCGEAGEGSRVAAVPPPP